MCHSISLRSSLEAESHARGYDNVKCNVLEAVTDEAARETVIASGENIAFKVADGDFAGWQLTYCKGPDGEQLEFTHELMAAGRLFNQALGQYVSGKDNEIW